MKQIEVNQLSDNFIEAIGKEWMLVTAGTPAEGFNTMTASWGGIGFLWNKPVVFVFVRPERYTFDFMERNAYFTLSFLGMGHRDIYGLCGSASGREVDKIKASGLHPEETSLGNVVYGESRLSLECKKLYAQELDAANFLSPEALEKWYGAKGGMHKMYIAELVGAWVNV